MPRTPTTPAQVSGHRFLVRRVEHALVRADSAMHHDPLAARMKAVTVGVVLMVLLAAGSVLVGVFRPSAAAADDASILLVRDNGALYVRIDGAVHPVSNLASARLVLGTAETPSAIRSDAVDRWHHGPAIGIENAPSVPAGSGKAPDGGLTVGVCENVNDGEVDSSVVRIREAGAERGSGTSGTSDISETQDNTVTSGGPDTRTEGQADDGGDGHTAIIHHGGRHWLLAEGTRAEIDPADPVVARALGLGSAPSRPVGVDLLRIIPERAAVSVPDVGPVGEPTGFAVPFDSVGNVVQVGGRYLVTRQGGAVDVPETAALVLASGSGIRSADDRILAGIPVAPAIDLGSLPSAVPDWAGAEGWLCVDSREPGERTGRGDRVSVSRDTVSSSETVTYPSAPGAETVLTGYNGPGHTVAVRTRDGLHLVSSTGVRHRVEDARALETLGFAVPPEVPWSGIAALPEGPELNRDAALQPL